MSRNLRGGLVAIVAGVLFVVTACGPTTGSVAPTSSPAASPSTAASPSGGASPSAGGSAALNQAMLQFEPIGGSNITGGAILTDLGDGTTAVTIGVVAAGITEPMPAELAPGTCAEMGAGASASPGASGASPAASPAASAASPAASGAPSPSGPPGPVAAGPSGEYKLNDLSAGSSNTVIATGLDALLGTPYAIVIHMSAADMSAVSCTDVKR